MKEKRVQKIIINSIYLLLWILPLFWFIRDFWIVEDIQNSFDGALWKTILFTWKQSLYSSFLAFFLAIIPARYLAYHNNLLSKMLESLLFIPFFFPVLSTIGIFSILFNLPGVQNVSVLYSMKAILIAHVFYNSPIFVKYLGEALRRIPKGIEESMILDGAGSWTIFWKGQLPLILPQIFKAFILCFTYCFLSFAILLSLGGIQYQSLEVEIAASLQGDFNFSKAMLYGLLQFFMLLGINSLGTFLPDYELKGRAYEKKMSGHSMLFSIFYVIFEYGIVLASIVASFYNYFTGEFSVKAYRILFSAAFQEEYPIWRSLGNSFLVAGIASIGTVIVVYFLLQNYSRIVELLIFSNLGISGAFFAITLYYVYVLYEVPFAVLLVFAYLMTGIPLVYSFLYQNVKMFPRDFKEMAFLDGASPWKYFWSIQFPILRPLFLLSFLQSFAIFLGEFTLAYTMQLGDMFPVVSLVNYSLLVDKKYLESSALSAILLALILLLFFLGECLKTRGERYENT